MAVIEKVIGRAGTGKTYYLTQKLNELFEREIIPYQVAMITYSKTAARIFQERVLTSNPQFELKDLKNFSTMHSMAAKLTNWKIENVFDLTHMRLFIKSYYPDYDKPINEYPEDEFRLTSVDKDNIMNRSIFNAMGDIDRLLRDLLIHDFDFNEMMMRTGKTLEYRMPFVKKQYFNEKYDKNILEWGYDTGIIDPVDIIKFSENYKDYKELHNLMDYTDMLERCLNERIMLNVKYMFCDEFQDFNTIQYKLYQMWRNNPFVEHVCIAGDDAQTVTRYAGASPKYFIHETPDIRTVLPRTYRHGETIFYDAQKYIERMCAVEECDVLPDVDKKGVVIKVYGDEWKQHLSFDDEETVLLLGWSAKWVNNIYNDLRVELPDTFFSVVGKDLKEKRALNHYNIIASLHRGERVSWDDVKQLFMSTENSLPTKMLYSETISTLSGIETVVSKKKILKSVKQQIKEKTYSNRECYNKEQFASEFLTIDWNGKLLMNNIKDINLIDGIQDKFPEFVETKNKYRISTIHRSKGDEADTVFLFMSVPYPAVKNAFTEDGKDDILHVFYVGKTRPKYKLIEVYDYLRNGNGDIAPSPLEVV